MLYLMNFWRYLDLVVIPLEMIDCNWRIASHYVVTDLDVTQRLGIAMCLCVFRLGHVNFDPH